MPQVVNLTAPGTCIILVSPFGFVALSEQGTSKTETTEGLVITTEFGKSFSPPTSHL